MGHDMRVRVGVVRDHEGWWVALQALGGPLEYLGKTTPGLPLPFASEEEAEAKAKEVATAIRRQVGADQ